MISPRPVPDVATLSELKTSVVPDLPAASLHLAAASVSAQEVLQGVADLKSSTAPAVPPSVGEQVPINAPEVVEDLVKNDNSEQSLVKTLLDASQEFPSDDETGFEVFDLSTVEVVKGSAGLTQERINQPEATQSFLAAPSTGDSSTCSERSDEHSRPASVRIDTDHAQPTVCYTTRYGLRIDEVSWALVARPEDARLRAEQMRGYRVFESFAGCGGDTTIISEYAKTVLACEISDARFTCLQQNTIRCSNVTPLHGDYSAQDIRDSNCLYADPLWTDVDAAQEIFSFGLKMKFDRIILNLSPTSQAPFPPAM